MILGPIKQCLKDLATDFASHPVFSLPARQEQLHHMHHQLEAELGLTLPTRVHDILARRVDEISKEEKLARDRLKDFRNGVSKKFKDLAGLLA